MLAREREGDDTADADGSVEAEAAELAHELDGEGHADDMMATVRSASFFLAARDGCRRVAD